MAMLWNLARGKLSRRGLEFYAKAAVILGLLPFFLIKPLRAQSLSGGIALAGAPGTIQAPVEAHLCGSPTQQAEAKLPEKPQPQEKTTGKKPASDGQNEPKQPKRILYIIPNYRAVSADTQLPALTAKQKFSLATQDSFDYSSFTLVALLAEAGQLQRSYPEFGDGLGAYGRYYWHSFVDQAVGNYMTEAIVPVVTREDPRYYTLGHGGVLRRTGYAISRLLVTRTDSGGSSFNFSEIVGNGAAAGIAGLYYPSQERTWTKTGQRWLAQVAIDGAANVFKEFWPDISNKLTKHHP